MGVLDRIRERRDQRETLAADNEMLRERLRVTTGNAELIAEHYDELVADLVADEAGWLRIGENDLGDWSMDRRRRAIARARIMAVKNPLVRRQVRTQVAYVFGRGVEIGVRDPDANDVVQAFLADERNAGVFTSDLALADRERDLQTDGELFVPLFIARDEFAVTVRLVSPTQIEHVVCNPDDAAEPRYYLRHYIVESSDGREDRYVAYVDHRYAREIGRAVPATVRHQGHDWEVVVDAGQPVPMMHVKVGEVSGMRRGLPEVLAMMDWASAYKAWLEDWASIARSLARFAWKASTKGNPANAATRLGSRLATGLDETNPAPAAGSIFVRNEGADLEPIRTQGAAPKAEDGLLVRKMAAAGSSFPDTILAADPDMGNLATARTLDRPTELTIEMRQKLWRKVLGDLVTFVLAAAVDANELDGQVETRRGTLVVTLNGEADPTVDVDFPPVLERDLKETIGAAVSAATLDGKAAAGTLPPRVLTSYLLTALGIDDQDEILGALFPDENDPLGIGVPDEEADAAEAEIVQAARELRGELERLAEAE